MKEQRIIYSLKCPFTNEVHYIGKSEQGMLRPLSHISNSHSDKINEWVGELKQLGHVPNVEICEYVPLEENIIEREKYWINKYLKKGNVLLNIQSTHPLSILPDFEDRLNDGDDFRSQLASFLKSKRKLVGLTQYEFAQKSGIGIRWLRDVEQRRHKDINLSMVIRVLRMFGCTIDIKKYENSRVSK